MSGKVLIVDDEIAIREMLKDVLEEAGHETEVALCAEDALEILPRYKPDIIVSDIRMPGMDGNTFCRTARKISDASILKISGIPSEISFLQGRLNGADDFLIKPFDVEDFVERIEFLLEKRRFASDHPSDDARPGRVEPASEEPKLSRPRVNILGVVTRPLIWIVIALMWGMILIVSRYD